MRTIDEQGYHFEEWLTPQQIAQDVAQVADRVSTDYAGKEPLFVVVLNGAFVFAADLIRALNGVRCEVTFIRVSSYFGMATSGGCGGFRSDHSPTQGAYACTRGCVREGSYDALQTQQVRVRRCQTGLYRT